MGEEAPKMPLAKMIYAVRLGLGVLSKKEALSDILKRLEQTLPEKPEWIILSSLDGLLLEAVNIDTSHEERNPRPILAALWSLNERVAAELNVGEINFIVHSSSRGLVLLVLIDDSYFLGLKFRREIDYAGLANIGSSLHPHILRNLSKILMGMYL